MAITSKEFLKELDILEILLFLRKAPCVWIYDVGED